MHSFVSVVCVHVTVGIGVPWCRGGVLGLGRCVLNIPVLTLISCEQRAAASVCPGTVLVTTTALPLLLRSTSYFTSIVFYVNI